jgi:hypothetical protein
MSTVVAATGSAVPFVGSEIGSRAGLGFGSDSDIVANLGEISRGLSNVRLGRTTGAGLAYALTRSWSWENMP